MDAISGVNASGEARAKLIDYQQQLARELAAKAAAKVVTTDREAVAEDRRAVQQTERTPAVVTAAPAQTADAVGATFDVTV